MHGFAFRAGVLACALAACACFAWSQPKLMNLTVVALDKSGQPMTDLQQSDFQVSEDGKARSIAFFRANDNRRVPGAPAEHEFSNRTSETPMGATIVIYDLLNGTFTDRSYIASTIVKALAKIEKPGNVFLYFITNKGEFYPIHPMPGSEADAAKLDHNWTTQSKAMIDNAIQQVYGLRPMDDRDIGIRAVTAYDLLEKMGEAVSTLPGRKHLVWITDGVPLNINYGGICHDVPVLGVTAPCTGSFVDFTPVVRKVAGDLDRDGITIYPVEAYGVSVVTRQVLDALAQGTGGKVFASAGINDALIDAVEAGRANYTLEFQPPNWDGKYHKVKVTTARKGLQLLYEQGYTATAPKDETANLVQTAAFSSGDCGGVGLRATESAGSKPGAILVKVRIDPATIAMLQRDGKYNGDLALVFLGMTDQGPQTLGKPNALSVGFTQPQYETALKDGIPVGQEFTLPAKVHKLRVVVVDRGENKVGSLTLPAAL